MTTAHQSIADQVSEMQATDTGTAPDGSRLYVLSGVTGPARVTALDTFDDSVAGTLDLSGASGSLAVSADGSGCTCPTPWPVAST